MRRLSLFIVALLLVGTYAPVGSAQIGIGRLIEGPERTRPDLPPPPERRIERDPLVRLLS